ncbi:MAG: hypothetical protein E3J72_04465 [Planctomycetota bacterium]|nr:MAG: hypothetical protein E3J72_04465 [Planctomycetota bacterium]
MHHLKPSRSWARGLLILGVAVVFIINPSTATGAQEAAKKRTLPKWSKPAELLELIIQFNKLQEPELDVDKLKKEFKKLLAKAEPEVKSAASPKEKAAALAKVLFGERGVEYLSNMYWRDSTLAGAVLRKKGNCLATTTLYVLAARHLGMPVFPVSMPEHIYARFDDGDQWFNIETTTSEVGSPEESFRKKYDYTEEDSRLMGYGRNLSEKEYTALMHKVAADHLADSQRPREAFTLMEKALELWPGNPNFILRKIGILYTDLGKKPEALAELEKLEQKYRSGRVRISTMLFRVTIFQEEDMHEEALFFLKRIFKLAPKSSQYIVLNRMSRSYRAQRKFREMLLADELAAILHGKKSDFVSLAIAYKNAGDINAAIGALRLALRMNPECWNTRLILAGYMIRAGRDDEGWKMFETVQKPRTDLLLYETNMAWFYGSVGKKKEFLEHLENALKMPSGSGVLSYVKMEVDFDRYRDDPDFKALIEKYSGEAKKEAEPAEKKEK